MFLQQQSPLWRIQMVTRGAVWHKLTWHGWNQSPRYARLTSHLISNDQAETLKALPEAVMAIPEVHHCTLITKATTHSFQQVPTPSNPQLVGEAMIHPLPRLLLLLLVHQLQCRPPLLLLMPVSPLQTSPLHQVPQPHGSLPPVMFEQQQEPTTWLQVWQQNLNNSLIAQHSLLNGPIAHKWNIIALQEPHINSMKNTISSPFFHTIYLSTRLSSPESKSQAVMLVSKSLDTDSWQQIPFPSPDIVIIQLRGTFSHCTIFNIYNDCVHTKTQDMLDPSLFGKLHICAPWQMTIWFGLGTSIDTIHYGMKTTIHIYSLIIN